MLRTSPLARAALLGGLVLLLQIPVWMIHGLVGERSARKTDAIVEVSEKWGRAQEIVGPLLTIPYRRPIREFAVDGSERVREVWEVATFLPRELVIEGRLETQLRHRGIFEIPVYRTLVSIRGEFDRPDLASLAEGAIAEWDRAEVAMEVADPRGVDNRVVLRFGDSDLAFEPGAGQRPSPGSGIHVPIALWPEDDAVAFSMSLELRGSQKLRFAPVGQHTEVRLRGDWPAPSFQGAWLPSAPAVSGGGFEASWEIPYLGRDFPQQWVGDEYSDQIEESLFGVDLLTPVDGYRTTERSLKYQLMFLGLTFAVIWLVEILASVKVHPIQYALIGAALCIFYLLELSLSEHLGFASAYGLGALAVTSLVFVYLLAVLQLRRRALVVSAFVGGLYAYLFVLLHIEDYALLVGSMGLFLALATIMIATRRVDWYDLHRGDQDADD